MIPFLLKNWKIVIAGLCAFTIGFSGGKMYGQSVGYVKGQKAVYADIREKTLKTEVKNEKRAKKIRTLSDDDLRRRYCQWVRDDKGQCLRADIPLRP